MRIILLFFLLFTTELAFAQISREEIIKASETQLRSSLIEFREYLSLPNNGNSPADIVLNLDWTQKALRERGFQTQILTGNGVPHLFAQGKMDPKKKTILVYMQVDGQAVDSSAWNQESPYIPELMEEIEGKWEPINWNFLDGKINLEWKIFARSASDSKGPTMAFFSALDILQQKGIEPSVNLKLILDFQEEISSPELAPLVSANKDLFHADGILILDGTRHFSNLPNLAFGARGIVTATIKVFGPSNNLHSGQYGNFAPNPAFQLSRLLAAMKDESGKVLIPGFYEGVSISEADFKAMSEIPEDNVEMAHEMGFAEAEKVGRNYQEALQFPSLNIRGLKSGWVGSEVRTLIPAEAVVEIDIRTVKETPNERQLALLQKFILEQGYYLIEGSEPTEEERKSYSKIASLKTRNGSEPFRAAMDSEFAFWLDRGMTHVFGDQYIKTRQTGGSQPMAPFINILGAPAVSVRIPNPDNNIHGPNENIRIGNFLEGIQTCLGILTQAF
ncbi:M20/M25/M40 family metallo-hydrolase [Algoriphagus mannitolivorans]|uniref:M20/M25/M40 family metallo-hydrolase n=1 Tax=Algoriphagus mannitolivorans TaxID=226504 RepID=UPI000552F49D|nr:M20/M25/M40 family metallo-hydrolase [Algoriphagus mannitolivorans]